MLLFRALIQVSYSGSSRSDLIRDLALTTPQTPDTSVYVRERTRRTRRSLYQRVILCKSDRFSLCNRSYKKGFVTLGDARIKLTVMRRCWNEKI